MGRFKFSWRRGILIVIIVSVFAVFFPTVSTAHALLTGARALYTVWRFEREVLRTSRVGQYYEGLIFKHAPELGELLSEDPNSKEKFMVLGETTIPLLEAYLNGQGDSAIITAKSINVLKDILDGLNVAGSPSLQKDIQMEYERFPLDHFVGMSMNDAYAYVLVNFGETLEEPALVVGTDGKWAYYIYNGVYFEYPSNWYVQAVETNRKDRSDVIVIPSSENPSQWDGEWIVVGVYTNVPPDKAFTGNFSFNTSGYELLWKQPIQASGMEGVEYVAKYKIAGLVAAELYNPEKMMFVDAGVALLDPFGLQIDNSSEVVKERYEYLFHLVESVKIMRP